MKPVLPLEWEPSRLNYESWQEIHARAHATQGVSIAGAVTINQVTTTIRNNALAMMSLEDSSSDELTIIVQQPTVISRVSSPLPMLNLDDGGQDDVFLGFPVPRTVSIAVPAPPVVLSFEDSFSEEWIPQGADWFLPALGPATFNGVTGGYAVTVNGANSSTGNGVTVSGTFAGSGTTALVLISDANNTNGVNIQLVGNGAPNAKYVRVTGGQLQIVNSAYSAVLLVLTDAGALQLPLSPLVSAATQACTGLANKKTADTTSANATLTADAALTVTCNETGYYKVEVFLAFYEATLGTGGFQFDLNAGSATVGGILLGLDGFTTAALTNAALTSITTVTSAATVATAAAAPSWYFATGSMQITVAGTFGVRWAQNTISANVTTLKALSYIVLTKIG